ncbi:hypothetical protein Dimus_005064 [Dionaea muscipula]
MTTLTTPHDVIPVFVPGSSVQYVRFQEFQNLSNSWMLRSSGMHRLWISIFSRDDSSSACSSVPDVSSEPSVLETCLPLEPLEEENEVISEEESGPSSTDDPIGSCQGADGELEMPPILEGDDEYPTLSIDEAGTADAGVDAVGVDFDAELDDLDPNLGFPPLHLAADSGDLMVNPNALIMPPDSISSIAVFAEKHTSPRASNLNTSEVDALVYPRERDPLAPLPDEHGPARYLPLSCNLPLSWDQNNQTSMKPSCDAPHPDHDFQMLDNVQKPATEKDGFQNV